MAHKSSQPYDEISNSPCVSPHRKAPSPAKAHTTDEGNQGPSLGGPHRQLAYTLCGHHSGHLDGTKAFQESLLLSIATSRIAGVRRTGRGFSRNRQELAMSCPSTHLYKLWFTVIVRGPSPCQPSGPCRLSSKSGPAILLATRPDARVPQSTRDDEQLSLTGPTGACRPNGSYHPDARCCVE